MAKKVLVKTERFEGSVIPFGEHIKAKQGDVITVRDETWEAMLETFPNWFQLVAEEPSIEGVKTKGVPPPPDPPSLRKTSAFGSKRSR